jgi:hypothetical protein
MAHTSVAEQSVGCPCCSNNKHAQVSNFFRLNREKSLSCFRLDPLSKNVFEETQDDVKY